MSLDEELAATLDRHYRNWKAQTRFYGTVSVAIRLVLINTTALVAAEKTVRPYLTVGDAFFPFLAVLVAIGTALDAWLKPREKWRGFMGDRDEANALLMLVRSADPNDLKTLQAYVQQLRDIERRHVEKNVY